MKKSSFIYTLCGCTLIPLSIPSTYANISFGEADTGIGQIEIGGALRAKYQHKDYVYPTSDDDKAKFDVAILRVNYNAQDWFGQTEYRCYQYETLCDFSTLVSGYVGYRFDTKTQMILGLQPIAFGPSRYWDSSFYAGINNTLGLQDILNTGLSLSTSLSESTVLDVGYFLRDGGDYRGTSKDSARYSANFIRSNDATSTDLNEKNMWIARLRQDVDLFQHPDQSLMFGTSYWYSDIENKKTARNGSRQAWSIFAQVNYQDFTLTSTAGQLKIDNQDQALPDSSTVGSFDSEYRIANTGDFYSLDLKYDMQTHKKDMTISPYLVYSRFNKQKQGYIDSQRHIVGTAITYKNLALYSEYILSKNDPFIGGKTNALAEGEKQDWNKLLNLTFIYSF
jgi:hypothetical protein